MISFPIIAVTGFLMFPPQQLIYINAEQMSEISVAEYMSSNQAEESNSLYVSIAREKIIELAVSQKGIPQYKWGGKYYTLADTERGFLTNEDALDCSGFTQWVFLKALGVDIGEGTVNISNAAAEIQYDDLLPGDFGLLFQGGSLLPGGTAGGKVNHIGIYLGKDEAGKDIWCHCNKRDNTVVVDNFEGFKYFCRAACLEEMGD